MTMNERSAPIDHPPTTRPADPAEPNALGRAIALLGDEWTLLLLREALYGATRYGEYKAALDISDATLTDRLRRLTDAGLVERRVYSQSPLRADYQVTPAGAATWPFLFAIWDWERRWVPDRAAELPAMTHRSCGADLDPELVCASCSAPVELGALHSTWGPAGGWRRSIPRSTTRRRSSTGRVGHAGHFPETMAILGNRWSSALVAASMLGTTRFTDFRTRLEIPEAVLAERLEEFRAAGVLDHGPAADGSNRREYTLTPKGLGFLPVVLTMVSWAQRHLVPAGEGTAIDIVHSPCGAALLPRWRCRGCGDPVDGGSVVVG